MFQNRMRFAPRARGYTSAQLALVYGFPRITAPATRSVAILELGGTYRQSDTDAFCRYIGCTSPAVTHWGSPTTSSDADAEVALDAQVVIGATGGLVPIRFYWAPNTGPGFASAIAAVAREGLCSALSISWGLAERGWSRSDITGMETALAGLTIPAYAASGDGGSSDGSPGNNCDYPASSPRVVGVGGTTLLSGGGEIAWSSGGGGYSSLFTRPAWQTVPGNARMVPDVAAVADPATGYITFVRGQQQVIGGTSGAAPLWAALAALADSLGAPPPVGPRLWSLAGACTDIKAGSNGAFSAQSGPDPCTGLGTPLGQIIVPSSPPPPPPPPPPPSGVTIFIPQAGTWKWVA